MKHWLPLTVILSILILFFVLGGQDYFSFNMLQAHHTELRQWTDQHYTLAIGLFMLLYAVAVMLSFPGSVFLTLTGGFLFGPLIGTITVVCSATFGATILFLATRTALAATLESKAGPWLTKLEAGFNANAMNYLLVLRLVPLFPFWLINIVPGLLGVRTKVFILATFFGIIPGSFVYVSVGYGLGTLFAKHENPDLTLLFSPAILLPLLGLSLLALIPLVYNKIKTKRLTP